MRALRQYRRWSVVPALLWLALQSLMAGNPAMAMPVPPAGSLASLLAGGLPGAWICSAGGARLAGASPPGTDSTGGHCDWCRAFGAVPQLEPPPSIAPPDPVPALLGPAFWATPSKVRSLCLAAFRSRAPPF